MYFRTLLSKLHVTRLCHKRFGLTGETNRVFRKLEQKNPTVSYFETICIAAFLNKDGTIMKKNKRKYKNNSQLSFFCQSCVSFFLYLSQRVNMYKMCTQSYNRTQKFHFNSVVRNTFKWKQQKKQRRLDIRRTIWGHNRVFCQLPNQI